ncbi:MAG: aminotransferase class I/II-fold pyridoxal phosphate-dependent enzyme [Desulfobacteraceae bacterium]
MIQGHGGNIYAAARDLNCRPDEIVDMSSNINPLGMPPGLLKHLQMRLGGAGVLPEADGRRSIRQMARLLDVDAYRMLAGNGTTQFIYNVCQALDSRNVLIVGPTYADYADACRMHRVTHNYFLANADSRFTVDLDRLALSLDGTDTVFICNPNNPTGYRMPYDELVRLCRSHPKIQFVIDESYMPFASEGQTRRLVDSDLQNVSVLWSLSKIFGVPGLRAGFLIANGTVISRFQRYMQPWSMNSLAQAAVDYLCGHKASVTSFIETTRRFLQKERQRFCDELAVRSAMTVYPSCTSYILLKLPAGVSAQGICRQMLQNRILIRDCGNFHGLSDRFVRVSIKHPTQNRLAVDCLAKIVSAPVGCNRIGK